MAITIDRLGVGDEAIIQQLALDDALFGLEPETDEPLTALDDQAARQFLANPAVLYWVAREAEIITGFLYCVVVPLRSGEGSEVLLYEIGVHHHWRRKGIGQALLQTMEAWMREQTISAVWVLADNPEAASFYQACGFEVEHEQPTYLVKNVKSGERLLGSGDRNFTQNE
ncbi:MAG TPA: N-acetyltransferase [Herpetosiphon sp.]|uniref:GCN5-related N-acetyltransferase n=1 Tax=Herpetosiphon aurantiacus (strain ATCC 23779 / DSM 785 / 114-95) TaxID=316274 RepID=A9B6J7_HERA2|nr:GNAT family N-acetyltransferase [Herpetosiphon sp.]ABX02900.1 GCN5-related N-acetyltransferase [Herpetosiphon aurantiacus DSM 785]HBW53039.1 N-acetyltransferase [Herpetosiphon sp.]